MAFNTEEQAIIKYGVENGKSRQEVEKALSNFRNGIVKPVEQIAQPVEQPKQNGFMQSIKTEFGGGEQGIAQKLKRDIQGGADAYQQSLDGTKNPLVAGANLALAGGRVAGDVAGAIYTPVASALNSATGGYLGKAFEFVGKMSQQGKYNPINALTDVKAVQDFVAENPNLEEDFVRALNIAMASADSGKIEPSTVIPRTIEQVKSTAGKVSGVAGAVADKVSSTVGKVSEKVLSGTEKAPVDIMNRVARLTPSDANKFKKMTGKTQGEYLTETGNFGAPDKIITNEALKFTKSKASVDAEFAKMPGVYQDGSIVDALKGLAEKAQKTSGTNVPSPYLQQVTQWISKFKQGGLTMEEINAVKRLYEREVKLGYSKMINPEGVQKATNIDSALRKWQVGQAETLGFKNIGELNKQTQASKFLIDSLGKQIVGQNGLNGINLTDWIVLGGGDATSIAGFLTKKFFSSKAVQAKMAQLINRAETKGQINPDVGPTKVLNLPAPKEGAPQSSINTPIRIPSKAQQLQGTEIVPNQATRATQNTPQLKEKVIETYNSVKTNKSTAPTNKTSNLTIKETIPKKDGIIKRIVDKYKNTPNKEGGFIKIGKEKFPEINVKMANGLKTELESFVKTKANQLDNSELLDMVGKLDNPTASVLKQAQQMVDVYAERLSPKVTKIPVKSVTSKQPRIEKGQTGGGRFDTKNPLAKEAQKYKSAEEFVKAQGTPIYHGSPKADIIRKEGFKLPTSMAEQTDAPVYGDGVYFSSKKSGAYDSTHSKVNTIEGYIPKDLKLYPATEKDMFSLNTKALKQKGFDGVEVSFPSGEKHFTIFDPAKIQTREQLISVYDKVHGTVTDNTPMVLRPLKSTALSAKSATDFISKAKLNGNIAQALGERYKGSGIEQLLTDFYNKVKKK